MTQVIARTKIKGMHFEILVDAESALNMKKSGRGNINDILQVDEIFSDSKKGMRASDSDLGNCFGTKDTNEIAKQIILKGEVQITQEIREKAHSEKFKQVVDFFVKNAVNPQNDRPYTPERIERSLDEAGINIQNKPIESQLKEILSSITKILPIKLEFKKLKITIPAQYTGQAYSLINNYKEEEEWLSNGNLKVIINIPKGLQMEFYDKLNSITHGNAMAEELKE